MSDIKLEAVYYSRAFPRSLEVLTILGLVFDRIHFPYVSLPDDGFTLDEIVDRQEKLKKIYENNKRGMHGTAEMIAALQFTHWKAWTKEFLYYPHSEQNVLELADEIPNALVNEIYDLTFVTPPNVHPIFETAHTFVITPGTGGPSIEYPGSFHYPAGALIYAAKAGLPIVNDVRMLGMPSLNASGLMNNASALASILAVECVNFVLPQVPVVDVYELLDFRDEMQPYVKTFRLELIKLAKSLNAQLVSGLKPEEIGSAARFVVETEMQPLLEELKAFAESPSRPWYKMSMGKPLSAVLSTQFWMMPAELQVAKLAHGYAATVLQNELGLKKKEELIKRSPLYYLLQTQRLSNKNN